LQGAFVIPVVRSLSIIVGILVCSLCLADDKVARDSFRAGQWDGAAYFSKAGEFSHCAALSSQPKSAILYFLQTEPGNFFIAISRATWNIPEGKRYGVEVSVDGRRWGQFTADAVSDNLVRFRVEELGQVAAIEAATTMEVVAARETLSLSLKDSRAAVEALSNCVLKNYRVGQSTAAASSNPFEAKPSNSDSEWFGQFIESMLKRSGFEGPQRVSAKDVGYEKAMFGWKSAGAEGAVYSGGGFDNNLVVTMRSNMAGKCVGDFVATNPHKQRAGSWFVTTFEFACGRGDEMTGTGVMQVSDEKNKTRFVVVDDSTGEAAVTKLLNSNARLGDQTVAALFQ
jgi:hypothetical protein